MDFVNICRKALYFRGSLSICPAYAGMIPPLIGLVKKSIYLSRVCGDDPEMRGIMDIKEKFVPRMRG